MSNPQGPLPPPVEWAQRWNAILLKFNVEDCKNPEIKIEASGVYFKGVGGIGTEKKEFENTLELHADIDPEKSQYFVKERNVEMILLKKTVGPYWPRLLKQKMKYHWLKVDFARWKDEDDSDDEVGQNPDLEAMMSQIGASDGGQEEIPKLGTTPTAKGNAVRKLADEKTEEMQKLQDEIMKKQNLSGTLADFFSAGGSNDRRILDKDLESESEDDFQTVDEMASPVDVMPEEAQVDISGIDKVLLLQRLWENTSMLGFGALRLGEKLKMPFDKEKAAKAVKKDIDYFDGKPIKTDLSRDIVYTRLYDRDSQKAFSDVVKEIRVEMSELNKVD